VSAGSDQTGNAGGQPERDPAHKTADARERLRQRVDELLGKCNKVADQKRHDEPAPERPEPKVMIGRPGPIAVPSPVAAAAPPAIPIRERVPAPEPVEHASEPAPNSHRALVLEGNPLHRKVLVRALEKSGFEVDASDSAEEALQIFQRTPYGIVLLDCDTPEINGFRTAASMRTIEGDARHTPLVGLTGNAGQSHRMERKAAGIDNYLLKPFRRDRIDAVVSRYAPIRELRPVPQLLSLDKDRVRELQDLACDDPGLLDELIDLFLTETPKLIDQMRRATEDEDGPALRRAAHTLKGSSGQIGALRLQDICATIETLAGTGSLVGVEPLLSELSLAFTRSVGELRSLGNGSLAGVDPAGGTSAEATVQRPPKESAKSNDILVAEDDMLIARFLASSLSAAGFHVTHVRDGRAAVDAVHAKTFSAVILDINMPEMDGYQVLSEIRSTVGESTPVTIISSRHQEQDILRAFDLGVDDYLTKPFNPSEVVARIRRLVRQSSYRT
jgi:DNA-binding response OmpR family regulator